MMNFTKFALLFVVISLFVAAIALAQEENQTNTTINETTNETLPEVNETTNQTTNQTNNQTTNQTANETEQENETEEPVIDFRMTDFVPTNFELGDVQFNIQIRNTGDVELQELTAFITGKGFSTYEIMPIESLAPNAKSYIVVMGNFKQAGNITLTIKIKDKIFNQRVLVIDPNAANPKDLEELAKAEAAKKAALANLTSQLEELKTNFTIFEKEYDIKKNNNYDVSEINLNDLKTFLRDAQSKLVIQDVNGANASIVLALNEYQYQKEKLDNAKLIKKTILTRLKENAILISTMAGAIIALFTLTELLRKKQQSLQQKIKEMKVDKMLIKKVKKVTGKKPKENKKKGKKKHEKKKEEPKEEPKEKPEEKKE